MSTDWIPGAIRLDAGAYGTTLDLSYPPRLVLHTTEGGGTVQSLHDFYVHSTYWPNFTADIDRHVLAQHLPLSEGGRALTHSTATATNGANAIQVEIIGRAADAATWADADVEWLAKALAPALTARGVPVKAAVFAPPGQAQRMSEPEWRAFSGICGHEHVPENDHVDPGAFKIGVFLAALTKDKVAPLMHFTPSAPIVGFFESMLGSWLLAEDGAIYTLKGRFFGAPYGKAYWGQRKAARIVANPNVLLRLTHPYVVIDSDGEVYGRNGF